LSINLFFFIEEGIMTPIRDCMTSPVISVDAQATINIAAKLMCEKKISALLVKEGEDYVGIITKTDLVKRSLAEDRDPKTTNVHLVMSKPILSRDQYIMQGEANEFMFRNKIKHLVVTQGKKILGILTIQDLVSRGNE